MNWMLRRAARIVAVPNEEWRTLRAEPAHPLAAIRYVLLISLIPAAGWSLGLGLFGNEISAGRSAEISGGRQIAYSALLSFTGMVLWVLLSAGSMIVLARLFSVQRNWARALEVAAYSATPVALAGMLLIQPDLMSVMLIAYVHSVYVQYAGAQHLLNVKARDAAEFVALSTMALMVMSTLLGALGGRWGVF